MTVNQGKWKDIELNLGIILGPYGSVNCNSIVTLIKKESKTLKAVRFFF
jgi:hypothetical protein